MKVRYVIILLLTLGYCQHVRGQITTIWLTHKTNDPSHIVINWKSSEAGGSTVFYGETPNYGHTVAKHENVLIHHIEIPLDKKNGVYHFKVETASETSDDQSFKLYPSDTHELRIAVVGNWGTPKGVDVSSILKDDPHLLLTCGDNIVDLFSSCGAGVLDCPDPYLDLIASQKKLFASVPFMPILGNHDKQIRQRGQPYPDEKVYDIDATAFRNFFELPDDEWKWQFTIREFDLRFVALDIQHISDQGTTWQSCHDFHQESDQYKWYNRIMDTASEPFVLTLHNEKNGEIRTKENRAWETSFKKGSAVISGYGYFMEYAEVDGVSYYNTSLKTGAKYKDSHSKFLQDSRGYLLLRIRKNQPIQVEFKSLEGNVLFSSVLERK